MNEEDILSHIMERFHSFSSLRIQFLSAVEDHLVIPNVSQWDYQTVKHICKNGALYVRSVTDLGIVEINRFITPFTSIAEYSESSEDDLPVATSNKIESSSNTVDDQPSCSKALPVGKINCPICYKDFPSNLIEDHAASCVAKFDPRESVLDYNLIEIPSSDDDENITIGYEEEVEKHETKTVEELISTSLLGTSKPIEKLKIRRTKAWEDFCSALKTKPWFTGTKSLHVTFLGESGVDEGGLSREFFSGNFLVLY